MVAEKRVTGLFSREVLNIRLFRSVTACSTSRPAPPFSQKSRLLKCSEILHFTQNGRTRRAGVVKTQLDRAIAERKRAGGSPWHQGHPHSPEPPRYCSLPEATSARLPSGTLESILLYLLIKAMVNLHHLTLNRSTIGRCAQTKKTLQTRRRPCLNTAQTPGCQGPPAPGGMTLGNGSVPVRTKPPGEFDQSQPEEARCQPTSRVC